MYWDLKHNDVQWTRDWRVIYAISWVLNCMNAELVSEYFSDSRWFWSISLFKRVISCQQWLMISTLLLTKEIEDIQIWLKIERRMYSRFFLSRYRFQRDSLLSTSRWLVSLFSTFVSSWSLRASEDFIVNLISFVSAIFNVKTTFLLSWIFLDNLMRSRLIHIVRISSEKLL